MKTFIHTLLAVCLLMVGLPMHLSAQNAVQNAITTLNLGFDFLVKVQADKITSNSSQNYDGAYYKSYSFIFDKATNRDFDDFKEKLSKASTESYLSMMKMAHSGNNQQERVAYGKYNESTITFGANDDHNYNLQMLSDPKDKSNRYVFALVWYVNERNQLCASIYKFYGPDPQKKSGGKNLSDNAYDLVNMSPNSSAEFMESYVKLSNVIDVNVQTYIDMKESGLAYTANGKQRINDCSAVCTAAATKIATLCKEKKRLLDKDDRAFVTNNLMKLIGKCDKHLDLTVDLLSRAQKALQ